MAEELEQKVEATERDFVNFVGDNADKYLRKFRKFNVDGVDNFAWTWHWPACLFGFWWLFYRKLYIWALIGFFLVFIPFWIFVSSLVYGPIANYIYYKRAKKNIIKYKTAKAPVDPHNAAIALGKKGGVKVWVPTLAAFTILITIVLHLVLGYFFGHRSNNYKVSAKADLRNAVTAQEAYYVDFQTYADSLDKLLGPEYGLYLSNGVTVVVLRADSNSYEMTSFHEREKKRYTLVGPDGEIQESDLENE
jgi:hypothetical protein